jgi:hypothetical protein
MTKVIDIDELMKGSKLKGAKITNSGDLTVYPFVSDFQEVVGRACDLLMRDSERAGLRPDQFYAIMMNTLCGLAVGLTENMTISIPDEKAKFASSVISQLFAVLKTHYGDVFIDDAGVEAIMALNASSNKPSKPC